MASTTDTIEPVSMTLTLPFGREGLLDLRDRIDELLALPPDEQGTQVAEVEPHEVDPSLANDKVSALHARAGKASWAYLLACAENFAEGEEWTLDYVAHAMDKPLSSIKAYHRNIGRSEKQVSDYLAPGVPPLFETRWDGERNWYRMPEYIRAEILSMTASSA